MKTLLFQAIAIILTIFIYSCTYHNEDEYFKDNPAICYTEDLSYNKDIKPLLNASCVSCHSNTNQQGGVNLEDYSAVASSAQNGTLVSVIKHEKGFSPMPAYQPKLDDCTIAKIEAWVNDGFKNN